MGISLNRFVWCFSVLRFRHIVFDELEQKEKKEGLGRTFDLYGWLIQTRLNFVDALKNSDFQICYEHRVEIVAREHACANTSLNKIDFDLSKMFG
jgi:hypothetical protein